jgi:hypothetical protein
MHSFLPSFEYKLPQIRTTECNLHSVTTFNIS